MLNWHEVGFDSGMNWKGNDAQAAHLYGEGEQAEERTSANCGQ